MPRQPIRTRSPLEDKVQRLENELYMTRSAMIDLMRPDLRDVLTDQVLCKTFKEVAEWESRATEGIIAIALRSEQPAQIDWDGRVRVLCPLCNEGPQSPYDKGFLPEGLRRHLTGTYNSRQCPVFKAANEMALDRARRAEGR
ncbi:hypothetical protein CBM2585_A60243 [Cupriavidus taiwanensis]|nr:hypothetical protein CBM2585_A60243 [Cupriavidus taiwanensis]